MKKTYKTTLVVTDDTSYVPVPFDPKAVFVEGARAGDPHAADRERGETVRYSLT